MAEALAPVAPVPLDARALLRRIDHRLALLRAWLSHDHGDEPFWWARKITAPQAQYERFVLRQVANLLHVERATARGRCHGTWFADLDEQRTWLAGMERRTCVHASRFAGLPEGATLAMLRAGELAV